MDLHSRKINGWSIKLAHEDRAGQGCTANGACATQTKKQAANSIFDYIEVFYNRQRKHSSLNYLSPAQFEQIHNLEV